VIPSRGSHGQFFVRGVEAGIRHGHSFQAISLLVQGPSGHVAAVPLTSRIHEELALSNRDSRTLLDEPAALPFSIASVLNRMILLVADAYDATVQQSWAERDSATRGFPRWGSQMKMTDRPS